LDKSYMRKLHRFLGESYIGFWMKVIQKLNESYESYIDLKVTHDSYI